MPANSTSTHLPVPGDDEITRLLQAVWDALDEAERWPTFETIDRAFWVQHRVDAAKLIARIPQVLLHGGRPQGGALPAAAGELSLTVAGAAACDGTEQVLQVVVAAARLAADAYLSGDPAEPGVTFDQVVAHLGVEVPPEDERELARRSGMLLVQEPWRVQTNVNESGWTIKVDRGIRPYAGVETVEQYWQARQEQLAAEQDQVAGQIWAGASLNGDPSPVPDEQVSTSGESVQTDPSAPASPVDEDAPANSGPPAAEENSNQGSHSILAFLGLVGGLFAVLLAVIQATNAVWAQIAGSVLGVLMFVVLWLCVRRWNRRPRLRKVGLALAALLAVGVVVVLIVGNATEHSASEPAGRLHVIAEAAAPAGSDAG